VLASPLARKLATDLGIDLRQVQGTGPGGRIVERDVKAAQPNGHSAEVPATASAPPVSADAPLPAQLAPERRAEARPAAGPPAEDVVKPLSMMRRTIATRLLEAKTSIPHFYLTADVDMDAASVALMAKPEQPDEQIVIQHVLISFQGAPRMSGVTRTKDEAHTLAQAGLRGGDRGR